MTLFHTVTPAIRQTRFADIARSGDVLVAQLITTMAQRLARISATLRRRRDEAELAAMPFGLRKDLGWPAGDTDHARRNP